MEKVGIKKELENLNETLAEDVNKMNIDVYGKKFVDLANQYIKDNKKYLESIIDTSIVFYDISEDKKETFIPSLMSDINNLISTAYLDGLYQGHKFKGDPYELSDNNIIDKSFMITFEFGDNDFGGYIEDAIKTWVDTWNSVTLNIKRYRDSESEHMLKYEFEKLEKLEDITNISKLLANGVVASIINRNNEYIDTTCFKDIDSCMKNAREYVDYLKLLNTSEYHKGSIEEITNFILTKYKNMQSEDEGYDLEHTWLNGEVLIIKVENGYASAWVQ